MLNAVKHLYRIRKYGRMDYCCDKDTLLRLARRALSAHQPKNLLSNLKSQAATHGRGADGYAAQYPASR